jgi:hypothetical protein
VARRHGVPPTRHGGQRRGVAGTRSTSGRAESRGISAVRSVAARESR